MRALSCPTQRLAWDAESFQEYTILRTFEVCPRSAEVLAAAAASEVQADLIYCEMPCPYPLQTRDTLQRRLVIREAPPGRGLAMVCQSVDGAQYGVPKRSGRVRAWTHLSGYLLRDGLTEDRVELVALSQCDVSGAVPVWVQNLMRRVAKQRPLAWAKKLEAHVSGIAP